MDKPKPPPIDRTAAGYHSLPARVQTSSTEEHNARFRRACDQWSTALYRGKYDLFGDADLTSCAFLIDTALCYLGVVSPVYRDRSSFAIPVFGLTIASSRLAHGVLRRISRRLQTLAHKRLATGLYRRRNRGHRLYITGFDLNTGALAPLLRGISLWIRLESEQILRSLGLLRASMTSSASDPTPHMPS